MGAEHEGRARGASQDHLLPGQVDSARPALEVGWPASLRRPEREAGALEAPPLRVL